MVTLDVNPFGTNDVQYDAKLENPSELKEPPWRDIMAGPASISPKNTVFHCDNCTYESQSQELFDRHVTRHSMDRPFDCTLCDYSVLDSSRFVNHLFFHQQSKVIQCPFCPYESYASTMKLHMLKHRAVEVSDCPSCEFFTNNPKSLTHHAEVYHSQMFKCEYCEPPNLTRMTKHSLINHWDEVHGIKEVTAETASDACAQWNNLTPSKPGSSCSMLSSEVIVKSEYAQDPEDGIINSVNVQGLTVVQSSGEFVTEGFTDDDIERAYDCPVCEFSSPLKVLLKFHILSMHTKKFSCKHCSAMMTKHALIQHSKNAHGIHIYFDGKGLKANSHLEIPVNSLSHSANYPKSTTHPENHEVLAKILRSDNKFVCSICQYSSPHRIYVQEHVDKLHCRKFFCNHCSAIMTKHALVEHARVKHGVTININNRYLVAAKPDTYSRPVCESDSEESNKNSEEDPDPADAWSSPMPVDVSRYIVQKGGRFFCSVCQYSVLYRSKMEGHVEKVHVKKYHCKHCPVIMSRYDLIEHSMAMHGISMSVKSRGLKEVREDLDETSQGMDDQGCNDTGFDNDYHETFPSLNNSYVDGGIKPGKPFACFLCDFSSHNEWGLTCHMKVMHTIKYHCNHCPAMMTKYEIIKHSLLEHGVEIRPRGPSGLREARDSESQGEVQNIPSPEDKLFTTDHFIGHFMDDTRNHSSPNPQNGAIKTNNPLSCAICGFTARSKWLMMKHMDLFHGKKYCCPHCPALMTKHELIEHGWSTHGVTIKAKNRFLKVVAQDSGSSDPSGNTDSSDCEDSEFGPSSFRDKSASKKVCPFCEHTYRDIKLKVHIERMHTGKYHCEHCTAVMTKYDLIKHYEKEHGYHFGRRGYRGYRFNKADGLTEGQVSKEQTVPDEKASKSICSFCYYTSPNSFNVQVHVQSMHVIKYHCERCTVVTSKYDLIQHYKNEHSIVIPPSNRGYKFKRAVDVIEGQGFEDQVVKTESVSESMTGLLPSEKKNDPSTSRKSCSFCEYSTVFPKDVKTHEERMHRIKFHCNQCSVVMVKYNLLRHIKNKHGIVLPSNHRFRQAIEVSGHEPEDQIETIQSDEEYSEYGTSSFQGNYAKNNVCSFCGYVGKLRYHVQIHVERMHTRKYHCEHCTAVMTKYDLIQHYGNLHGVTIQNGGRGLHFVEAITEQVTGNDNQVPEPACPPFTQEKEGTMESVKNLTETESCSICDFSTKKLLSLEVHMENWHKRKYVCNDCPAVMTKHEILEHSKDIHGVIIPRSGKPSTAIKPAVQDPVKETNPDNLENGEPRQTDSGFKVDSTGEAFKCDFCGFSSAHRKSALMHVINMHRKKYSCNDCTAVLTKYELIFHYKDVHGVEIPWNFRGHVFKQVTKEGLNEEYQTDVCSEVSSKSEIPEKSTERDSSMLPNVDKVLGADGTGRFKCSDCEFSTLYPSNLKVHGESVHTKLFCCDKCPAIKTKYELVQHYKNEHNVVLPGKSKRFKEYCPESGQANTTSSEPITPVDIGRHSGMGVELELTSTDNDESEFIHSVNGRPRSTLKPEISSEHTVGHEQFITVEENGEMFSCSVCGFPSKYKSNLIAHFKVLHTKKFCCDTCSTVMTKYDLIRHYKDIHNVTIPNNGKWYRFKEVNEKPEQADETDDESEPTIKHEMQNESITVERNGDDFICTFCGLSSKYKNAVQSHVGVMHMKKYGCKDCSTVMSKYDLIQHYESVHSIIIPNLGRGHTSEFFRDSSRVGDDENLIKIGGESKCSLCDYSSPRKKSLLLHFQSLHKKKYSCNRCSVIMTKYEMIRHYETDHDVVIEKSSRGHTGSLFTEVHVSDGMDESVVADDVSDDDVSCLVQDDSSVVGMNTDDNDGSVAIIQEGGEYKCSICGLSTAFKSNLKPHFESFHRKKYSCNRCSIVTTKYGIVRHYENTHRFVIPNFGKGNLAPYCKAVSDFSEVMDSSVFAEGMVETVMNDPVTADIDGEVEDVDEAIIEEGGELKCVICGHSSAKKGNLRAHVEKLHRKKYSCNRCSLITTKYDMVQHYETDHGVVIGHLGKSHVYFVAIDGVSEGPESSVFTGDLDDNNDAGRINIIKEGEGFMCSACGLTDPQKVNIKMHIDCLHKKKYSCNRCSIVLTKYEMIQHYDTDHKVEIEKSGTGPQSQYFTEVDHGMMQHIENDHGVEIPYKGRDVTIQFSTVEGDSNMSRLGKSESQHTSADGSTSEKETVSNVPVVEVQGIDELKCTKCDHSTKYKSNMRVHMETLHTRKFSCNYCSVIMTKHDMMQHCENEHGIVTKKLTIAARLPFVEVSEDVDDPTSLADREPTVSADSAAKTAFGSGGGSMVHFKDSKDLACNICGFFTNHGKSMEMHMVNFHKRTYACDHCEAVFTKYSLIKHCKNVHGVTISGYNRNMREVKSARKGSADDIRSSRDNPCRSSAPSENLTTFNCSLCNFTSKLRMHLQVHTKNMHSTKHSITEVHESESYKEYDVSDAEAMQARNTLSCTICSFTTKAKWYLKDHMTKFHRTKYYCTHCPAVLTKHALIKHCKNVHGVVYSSRQPLCEAKDANSTSSAAEGNLELGNCRGTSTTSDITETSSVKSNSMHAEQEITDRAQCSVCDFSTPNKWYLREHTESFHRKKYSCTQCSAVMTKYELFKHSKERHGVILKKMGRLPSASAKVSSENHAKSKYATMPEFKKPKRFPCAVCSFSSFHPFGLKRHVKIHHTIKYPCQYCPAVMTWYELIKHCRNMHNTQSPESHLDSTGDCSEPAIQHSNDHTYSAAMQESTESQIINPKFQDQLKTSLKTIQSPTYQPVVVLERLPIDVDDLDATFSVVDDTNATDAAMVKNPKFHDSSYHQ